MSVQYREITILVIQSKVDETVVMLCFVLVYDVRNKLLYSIKVNPNF
jgi:hypothetical protein